MEAKLKAINEKFAVLCGELTKEQSKQSLDNAKRRKFHSKLELVKLDLLEFEVEYDSSISSDQKSVVKLIIDEIDKIVPQLNLVPIKRSHKWWSSIEVSIRFLGVCSSFLIVGTACSLPLLLMRAIDELMQVNPFNYRSEYFKRSIAHLFLYQSGIIVDIKGLKNEFFKESCALLCFNHASNLDGFLVSGYCPIRQLAFGKKELFLVPFFSWISLAFGGVPVDRGNRDRAVGALKRSAESAKSSKVCIAIAPEGTRSLTGQLLPFKKGPFYMWDELKAPIVPMIIYGAYDLYPVGSWVNQTGHITVKYLPPIRSAEADTKDKMLVLLRRRMLEALADCPADIGRDVSAAHWMASTAMNVLFIVAIVLIYLSAHHLFITTYKVPLLTLALYWAAIVFGITFALYVYYVYLIDLGRGGGSKTPTSAKKNMKGKAE